MDKFFKNREDAALKLIRFLEKYKNDKSILLAIPRGGVPIAYPIAKKLGLPVELLMTKKIGHPSNPEYAIGAVGLEDELIDEHLEISPSYINNKIEAIRKSLQDRYKKFMGNHTPASLENKVIIIVDDGMATGNTILSSLHMLRRKNPQKIIVAVPVASAQAVAKIGEQVNELICLYIPEPFHGVGLHYVNFDEVSDEDVIRMLNENNAGY